MSDLTFAGPRGKGLSLLIVASTVPLASVSWARITQSRLDAALLEAAAVHPTQDAITLVERGADPNAIGMFPTCGAMPTPWTWSYCREWFARQTRREDE